MIGKGDDDFFVKFKETIQSLLSECKQKINEIKECIGEFKKIKNWEKKFQSIVDELETLENTFRTIVEQCKSCARQQADVFQRCCKQFKIIKKILNDANNNLEQRHLNSIVVAKDRIIESLAQIEIMQNKLNEIIKVQKKLLTLNQKLYELKINSDKEAQKLLKILTIGGVAAGATAGAAFGAGVLLAEAFGGLGVCCIGGLTIAPVVAVCVPLAIGAIVIGGLVFGITKYIQNKNADARNKVDTCIMDTRKSTESFMKIIQKLPEIENQINFYLNDLNKSIEDEYQAEELLNSETISKTIEQFQKMKSTLDEIINFSV